LIQAWLVRAIMRDDQPPLTPCSPVPQLVATAGDAGQQHPVPGAEGDGQRRAQQRVDVDVRLHFPYAGPAWNRPGDGAEVTAE
jgi:hypothetical protein